MLKAIAVKSRIRDAISEGMTRRIISTSVPLLAAGLFFYFFVRLAFSFTEFLLLLLGAFALWAPMAIVLHQALREEVRDSIPRTTFALIGSYTLTTLLYFLLAAVHVAFLFYCIQAALVAVALMTWRRRRSKNPSPAPRFTIDWILVLLLALVVVVNISYKEAFRVSSDNKLHTYLLGPDQFYHAGQAYELSRGVPPKQMSIRAGTPERAYHNFPHVTTMLIGRFTHQSDMLRAGVVYHYTIIDILIALALYSIVAVLTRSRWPGYATVCLMYVTVLRWPELKPSAIHLFYFTSFPHLSSGLEPVIFASPQMYSGLLVMYGVLLGVALIGVNAYETSRLTALLAVTGAMVAACLKFRVQVFVPMLPGFLVILMFLAFRIRTKFPLLVSAFVAVAVSALLYAELHSSVYLKGTSGVRLGYNALAKKGGPTEWINAWPFSGTTYNWLSAKIPDPTTFDWTWEFVSLSAFGLLNIVGLPLLMGCLIYFATPAARREHSAFTILVIWMTVMSIIAAAVVGSEYDRYSVGGQMLFHLRWYVFPLAGYALWVAYERVQDHLHWPENAWAAAAVAIVLVVLAIRYEQRPGQFRMEVQSANEKYDTFDEADWKALTYLHDRTGSDSVLVTNKFAGQCVLSGLAGKAAYFDLAGALDPVVLKTYKDDDRATIMQQLWWVADERSFCDMIHKTPITHLIEYADHPLKVVAARCMTAAWRSDEGRVTIWAVRR